MYKKKAPLADRLRPKTLQEIVGQDHLLKEDGLILKSIERKTPLSFILWGPPGCGKTSLASLYAQSFSLRFEKLSPIFHGVADLKKLIQEEEKAPLLSQGLILFVDEIHRFNKAQQDAFLPYLENGTIVLIGATVENPSFYLNDALLSRLRVLKLEFLDPHALFKLIERYENLEAPLPLLPEAKEYLIELAQGDGRYLFNLIENIQAMEVKTFLDKEGLIKIVQKRAPLFDRASEQHYNLISALHKSIRGSDPDAALYWFCRMLTGGEDPLYIARRLIRAASEDIGVADPQALNLAIAARSAYEIMGSPEGELALAELVVYLSLAPKSNSIYEAYGRAKSLAEKTTHLSPPMIILNAPTRMMKELGYGKGYIYDHGTDEAFSGQNYFPDGLQRENFYVPNERGFEREMKKRVDYFNKLRKKNES